MGLVRTSAPAAAPVLISEVARWCKVPDYLIAQFTADLEQLITSAVDRCERVAQRSLITQTWRYTLDSFYDEKAIKRGEIYQDCETGLWVIHLPRPPLASVSSIVYVATDGTSTTLSSSAYQVDADAEPGRVMPAYGSTTWPTARSQTKNAVTITYTAGYGAAGSAVPSEIRDRLKAYCVYCWENRGDKGPMGGGDPLDEEYLDKLFLRFWCGG